MQGEKWQLHLSRCTPVTSRLFPRCSNFDIWYVLVAILFTGPFRTRFQNSRCRVCFNLLRTIKCWIKLPQLINTASTACALLVDFNFRQLCHLPIAVIVPTSSRTWKRQKYAIPWYVLESSHCCPHALTALMVSAGYLDNEAIGNRSTDPT